MAIADALIERKVLKRTADKVVIQERWNVDHPECPFVFMKPVPFKEWVKQSFLTPQEYDHEFGNGCVQCGAEITTGTRCSDCGGEA